MILQRILEAKREEVALRRISSPVSQLREAAAAAPPVRPFSAGFGVGPSGVPAVIAEAKKASPSKGVIRPDFDPAEAARAYEAAGAAAVSVLTDEKFFQGALEYLSAARRASALPVLRKDFIIDEYQVVESRAAGADAVLLIAAALEKGRLADLMECARSWGMECLVEVHDAEEMGTALDVGAGLIGINNRNLHTFEVDIGTTVALAPMAMGARLVSESGIFTREDMELLGQIGVDAALIGEALMREKDPGAALRRLLR